MHNFFNLTLPVLRIVVKIEASGTKMHLCKSSRKQKQKKFIQFTKGMFSRSGGDDDTPMHLF